MAQTYLVVAPGASPGAAPLQAAASALARLSADDSGQDLVEYALIASFMGLASIAGVNGLAVKIVSYLNFVLSGFNHAIASHH